VVEFMSAYASAIPISLRNPGAHALLVHHPIEANGGRRRRPLKLCRERQQQRLNLTGKETTLISQLDGLPKGVIGFEASGRIAAEDYRDVILPALEQAAEAGEVRFLIVMNDFAGMSGGAIWEDLKIGLEHLRSWKRIALVTDIGWMIHATDLFGWMTPGETKTFSLEDKDQAIRWVAG
jgi:hypothetical protein